MNMHHWLQMELKYHGDTDTFIDTGSYIFNALLSGSIYGGYHQTRLLQ